MAQTPKSVSSTVGVSLKTIYTVPSATNAVVKSVNFVSPTIINTNAYLYKTTGGVTYPVNAFLTPFVQGSGASTTYGVNLLPAPITLNASDSLSANTDTEVMPMIDNIVGLSWNNSAILWCVNKYANGIWLCAGNSKASTSEGPNINLVTSTDGKTWTYINFANDFYVIDAVFGSTNTWIMTGSTLSGGGTNGAYYYTTNNGSSWTYATITGATGYTTQCWYLNGNYFIGTSSGQLFYSTNATTWTDTGLYAYQPNLVISGMAYLNSKYVVTTAYNGQYTTTNLSTWVSPYFSQTTITFNGNLNGVIYNSISSKFFAGTNDSSGTGAVASSTDGITWSLVNTGTTNILTNGNSPTTILNSGGSNNYILVTDNSNYCAYSTDGGTTWTHSTMNASLSGFYRPYSLGNNCFIHLSSNTSFNITTTPWSSAGTGYSLNSNSYVTISNIAIASNGTAFCLWYLNNASPQTWSRIYNTANTTTGASYNSSQSIDPTVYGGPIAGCYFNSYYYILSSFGMLYRASSVSGSLTLVVSNLFGSGTTVTYASMAVVNSRLIIWNSTTSGFKSSADGLNWETAYPNFWASSYSTGTVNSLNRLASSGSTAIFGAFNSGGSGANAYAVTTTGTSWNNLPVQTLGITTVNSNTIQWILDTDQGGAKGIYTVTDASTPSTYTLIYNNISINTSYAYSYNNQAQAFYTGGKYHINGVLSSGSISSTSLTINTFYLTNYGSGYSFINFNNPNGLPFYNGGGSVPVLSSDGTTTVLIDLNSSANYYFDIYQGTWNNTEGGWVNLGVVETT